MQKTTLESTNSNNSDALPAQKQQGACFNGF